MHITLNGDAREFPLDTTVVETRWAMPASAWRWNATARSCPRASTRRPRWPTATRSRSWWRWAGLKAQPPGGTGTSPKGCGNAALLLYKARGAARA